MSNASYSQQTESIKGVCVCDITWWTKKGQHI